MRIYTTLRVYLVPTISFFSIFDDSISKIKVYVKNDRGDKIAVLEIPTVELSSEDSKGKWYPLKSKKSKSMNAQIKLKITIGVCSSLIMSLCTF